jgi:hypothetical protein
LGDEPPGICSSRPAAEGARDNSRCTLGGASNSGVDVYNSETNVHDTAVEHGEDGLHPSRYDDDADSADGLDGSHHRANGEHGLDDDRCALARQGANRFPSPACYPADTTFRAVREMGLRAHFL